MNAELAAVRAERAEPPRRSSACGRPLRFLGLQVVVLEAAITVVVMIALHTVWEDTRSIGPILRLIVGAATGLFALGGIAEALAAVRAPVPPPVPSGALPPVTAIIPAYLPNEADIVLETIAHHLRAAADRFQLVVAYNTPEPLDIEADLAEAAERDPRLVVIKVDHSTSKAENINAALDVATGEIIAIFDCDHHAEPGNFERAWRWLAADADVVQGRCAVRRSGHVFLDTLIAAEFETMYAVGHPGRARAFDVGLFGGRNGYWRADALRAIKFDATALTEDIDASVRLMRSGGKIVADPGILSTELSPPSFSALCYQRLRWAQGWFQVTRRHLAAVLREHQVPLRQRLGALWVFGVGAVTAWVAGFLLPLTVESWINPAAVPPVSRALFFIGSFAFGFQALVAYRHALPKTKRARVFVPYAIATIAFYGYVRVALVRLAHIHELAGRTEWRVTPRTSLRAEDAGAVAR